MMRQIGIVMDDFQGKAIVKVCRATACEHCGQCDKNERRVRSLLEPSKEIIVEAINNVEAKVGQTVEISTPFRVVLMAALWAYLVPFLAFVTGAVLGHWLGPIVGISEQAASICFGAIFLAGSYLLLYLKNKSFERDHRFMPSVNRVL